MQITPLPETGNLRNQKSIYDNIYRNDKIESKQNRENDEFLRNNIVKREVKKLHVNEELQCKPFMVKTKQFEATHNNNDMHIYKQLCNMKNPQSNTSPDAKDMGKQNKSYNLAKYKREVDNSSDGAINIIQKDLDNFYDSELIRKVSGNDGNLPKSLKLVINEDKDPVLVYDEDLKNKNIAKRKTKSTNTNVYYDYNYYDDQLLDDSEGHNAKKKFSTLGKLVNHPVRNTNISINDNIKEITNTASLSTFIDSKVRSSTFIAEENVLIESSTKEKSVEDKLNRSLNIQDTIFRIDDNFNNKLKVAVKRKGTCPSPDSPAGQNCHPGGGLPKNPGMPPLTSSKRGRDPEYEKLLRGETSEKVVKAILDKVHRNAQMMSELGICDFDMGELRTLFKHTRNKEKKECCLKLRGEFKCFLNWLLTIEPSRKKRSDINRDKGFTSCNQFPKFNIMEGRDYCKPSPQYEKLVQKVEEYRDDNPNL